MADHLSDATLLERFVTRREEEAFATLVRRHGPRVLSACRRILPSEHDAEDVFQATFLVLAQRAAEVEWDGSVGGWLCGVARRLSLNARAGASRRWRRETPVTALAGVGSDGRVGHGPIPEALHPAADPFAEIVRRDLRRALDDELNLLPEKYRAPVVLCDLEGLTHEEAAHRLGWPAGSISRRLGHARALLRRRLGGRGLPVAITLVIGILVLAPRFALREPRGVNKPLDLRAAMAPFKTVEDGGDGLEDRLIRIAGGERPASTAEARGLARQVDRLADRLADLRPAHNRPAWRKYGDALGGAARRLTLAAERDDAPGLVVAARRVKESCVQCHLAFRD